MSTFLQTYGNSIIVAFMFAGLALMVGMLIWFVIIMREWTKMERLMEAYKAEESV